MTKKLFHIYNVKCQELQRKKSLEEVKLTIRFVRTTYK